MTRNRRLTKTLTACVVSGAILSTALASLAAEPAGSTVVVVDDFESYTNDSPNRLYETWIDGVGYPGHAGNGSGSMVGHDIWGRGTPYTTIAETALIHGGKQSMPFSYYNLTAPFYSEVARTFATPQDWTTGGSNALSLWLRGTASNAADPLYVALEDAAGKSQIAVRGNAKAAQSEEWRQWQLALKVFADAGVNLQGVKRLRLGVGDRLTAKAGGAGILYVDDITVAVTTINLERPSGSLVAWGSNILGQATPPAGKDFIAIAGGAYFSLALRADGSIVGWGANEHGQATPPAGKGFRAIAAGDYHALAVKDDGSLVGWGGNDYRQATPPLGNDFVAVAAGDAYSITLKADGSLVGWGYNQLGRTIPPGGTGFTAVSAGSYQGQALRATGSVAVWGATGMIYFSMDGVMLGYGPSGKDFIAVGGGVSHGLALKADGSVVNWGTLASPPPTIKGFVAIAAGGYHDLALKADGSIVAWGRIDTGQATPPAGTGFLAIAAGREHSLAIKQE